MNIPKFAKRNIPTHAEWNQGDVFAIKKLHFTDSYFHRKRKTKLGIVVLSQTCDIVQNQSNELVVCPVVVLEGDDKYSAIKGKNARYISLPLYGDNYFADLAFIGTCSLKALKRVIRTPGVTIGTQREFARFGQLVGRRFSRFPFPDEVHPYLINLKDIFVEKSGKSASAQKWAMDQVLEIRIEAMHPNFWLQPPYEITLLIILNRGILPVLTNPPVGSQKINEFLNPKGGLKPSADRIATRLMENETVANIQPLSPDDKVILWNELTQRWANLIALKNPKKYSQKIQNALVADNVNAELIPEDEIPYSKIVRSQALDLQHLSGTYPLVD